MTGINLSPPRELNRKDQDRQSLRDALLEGAKSPQSAKADEDYFAQLRNRTRK